MLSVRAAAPRARVPHVSALAILDVRVAAMDFRAAMMSGDHLPVLVIRVVLFLEDDDDGRSAGTLSCGDDGWADMTAQDGCFY